MNPAPFIFPWAHFNAFEQHTHQWVEMWGFVFIGVTQSLADPLPVLSWNEFEQTKGQDHWN